MGTFVAEVPTTVLKIAGRSLKDLNLMEKLVFERQKPASASRLKKNKTSSEMKLILDAFKSNKHLSTVMDWNEERCRRIADIAYEKTVPVGMKISLDTHDPGEHFYVVKDGSFEILVSHDGFDAEHVGMVSKGAIFAEVAMACPAPRAVSMDWTALEMSAVWELEIDAVNLIINSIADQTVAEGIYVLEKLDFLSQVEMSAKVELARSMERVEYMIGH